MSELPQGWAECKLENVTSDVTYGYTAKSTPLPVGPRMLRITDIQENKVDWNDVPFCRISDSEKEKYLLKNGDLVFARTGATVGKSFLIRGDIPDAVYASYLIRVRCVLDETIGYINQFFKSPVYWNQITEFSSGIGQPNVNGSKLKELVIPLAPLPEQKRIADKLDTLLARVDNTRERLDRIPVIIKRFRQAVLAAATSGKLTEEWREENLIIAPVLKTLGDVIRVSSGKFLPAKNMAENGIIPVFGGNGVNGYHNESNVSGETLVIGRVGYYCGSIHLTPKKAWVTDNALIVMHNEHETLKKFLFFALQATDLRVNDSSTAQPVISGQKIYSVEIIIPQVAEQKEIVRRVEKLFAFADKLEARYNTARTQVDKLTPSLLAKAFRGELVEQDPNDEPAEQLLARIRLAKAEKPANKKPVVKSARKTNVKSQ